jgi:probable F420-dependent oxidoreductase
MPGPIAAGPEEVRRAWCQVCVDSGAESVWVPEHVVVARDYAKAFPYRPDGKMAEDPAAPRPDALTLLTWIGATTPGLRLGTAVLIAPLHSPAVLAKRAATLSSLSEGRLLLGLGIGWQEEEYAAVGVPFSGRGRRLEECIGAMRALWAEGPATYRGRDVTFSEVYSSPRPATGSIPIVLAGNGRVAIERAARIADGWFPLSIGPADFARRCDDLRRASQGRATKVEITAWPGSAPGIDPLSSKAVRPYIDAGASRIVVAVPAALDGSVTNLQTTLTKVRENILDRV